MYGAILGDIAGSYYERFYRSTKLPHAPIFIDGSRFTDDTAMTVAVADRILKGGRYMDSLKKWARLYPDAGYGGGFRKWFMRDDSETNDSFGNGAAMRVSPVGWAYATLEKTLEEAENSARPSHSHPEGIKGAQAVAAGIFMARTGAGKDEIKGYIERQFGYDLSRSTDDIRPRYKFSSWSQNSVPEAIICFLEADSFSESLYKAISLGGDSDTQADIAGALAEAMYGIDIPNWRQMLSKYLPIAMLSVADAFDRQYIRGKSKL